MAGKCADIGDGWDGVIPIIFVLTASYLGQLEAYYTGKVQNPFGNATSDGALFLIICYFVLGIMGDGILEIPVANQGTPAEVDVKDLLSLLVVIG